MIIIKINEKINILHDKLTKNIVEKNILKLETKNSYHDINKWIICQIKCNT